MKLTRRGEIARDIFYAVVMAALIITAFVLEAWLFGGAL